MSFTLNINLLLQKLLMALEIVPLLDIVLAIAIVVLPSLLLPSHTSSNESTVPFVNNRKWYELSYFRAKNRFMKDAKNLIQGGFEKGHVYRMVMDNGVILVLHPKYANEIRNIEGLSFSESLAEDFHAHISGFDPFTSEKLILDVIRNKLTKKLERTVRPLMRETDGALLEWQISTDEWRTIPLREKILELVARLTSTTLLGSQIGRDDAWRDIMVHYMVDAFVAAYILRLFPRFLRPFASHLIPQCRKLRKDISAARRVIDPVLRSRQEQAESADKTSEIVYDDGFEWLKQCAGGAYYDPVIAQLSLSVVAIHTTSDMLTQVLFDLAGRPQLIEELRVEIMAVFGHTKEGLTRGNLQQLHLMDSVLKESQRLKPINIVSMRRRANYDITLSDGTLIPKGTRICVSNHWMWDTSVYQKPEEFDPSRFRTRASRFNYDFASKFVSPSPEHLGFGLGRHACPGRFFAATEIKIILCHILLNYDVELPAGFKPKVSGIGPALTADPEGKLLFKKRLPEVELL